MIEQRPQEFLELLNQVDEGDDGDDEDPLQGGLEGGAPGMQGPPGTVTITLSVEDQQAINRVRSEFKKNLSEFRDFLSCFSCKTWASIVIELLKRFLLVIEMKN